MDSNKKKKIIIGAIVGAAGIIAIVSLIIFPGKSGTPAPGSGTGTSGGSGAGGAGTIPAGGITHATFTRSAYDSALARAATWQPDAALIKMVLNDATAGTWTFTFISLKNSGKGFEVLANGQGVTSATAVAYAGGGAPLPANIISPDTAMAAARAVPGYANASIVSLEMIYNASAKQWYWGVRTAAGATVTIKATN